MDGEHRIMISDAINESDRLSSCNKACPQAHGARCRSLPGVSVLIGSGGNGDDRAGVDAGTERKCASTTTWAESA